MRRAHSRNWNLRTRLAESWRKLPSAFSRTKTWIKKIYFRKTDSYSRPDKAVIIRISYKTAFIRTVLSVEKFTTVWNLIAYSLIQKKTLFKISSAGQKFTSFYVKSVMLLFNIWLTKPFRNAFRKQYLWVLRTTFTSMQKNIIPGRAAWKINFFTAVRSQK